VKNPLLFVRRAETKARGEKNMRQSKIGRKIHRAGKNLWGLKNQKRGKKADPESGRRAAPGQGGKGEVQFGRRRRGHPDGTKRKKKKLPADGQGRGDHTRRSTQESMKKKKRKGKKKIANTGGRAAQSCSAKGKKANHRRWEAGETAGPPRAKKIKKKKRRLT